MGAAATQMVELPSAVPVTPLSGRSRVKGKHR